MATRGRPTKRTGDVLADLCDALGLGVSHDHAAEYAGIAGSTLRLWLSGHQDPSPDVAPRDAEFLAAVKRAEAEGSVARMRKIAAIGDGRGQGAWQALAWIQERRYPKMYGRPQVDVKVRVGKLEEMPDDDLHALAAELGIAVATGGDSGQSPGRIGEAPDAGVAPDNGA